MSDPPDLTLTRPEVARLLGIEEWQLGNFASDRYPYHLPPTARRAGGRGKPGLYSRSDVYKIALAHRLITLGLNGNIVAEIIKALFPKRVDTLDICVVQRAKKIEDARYLVIDFSIAPWVVLRKMPDHWRGEDPFSRKWVSLWSHLSLASHPGIRVGLDMSDSPLPRSPVLLIMPFDELMARVDAQLSERSYSSEKFFDMTSVHEVILRDMEKYVKKK